MSIRVYRCVRTCILHMRIHKAEQACFFEQPFLSEQVFFSEKDFSSADLSFCAGLSRHARRGGDTKDGWAIQLCQNVNGL